MTFEDVLDQALAMLQRRGRVTYRTLKRQFNLDDEAPTELSMARDLYQDMGMTLWLPQVETALARDDGYG